MKLLNLLSHIFHGWVNLIKFIIYPPYRKKQKFLFDSRLKTCESCDFVNRKLRQCTICGCFIDAKTKVIYKLDEDGYSIYYIDPINKDVYYACPEKRW